ncbi:TPA: hypothetical protein ACKP5X_003623, partial [Stenotrophomonas maltophilia]
MQGQPEEPASILAVVGAGVQRFKVNAVEHGSTLQKPISIIAVQCVDQGRHPPTAAGNQQQRETVEG